MDNMAMALKNSNKAFLWAVKKPEKGSDSEEEPGGELPRGFGEEVRGRGLVVKWCEQEKVLMHPALGCFVTQCGWNSTLETVVAGVPIVGYPKWTDQPTNAKLSADVFKNGMQVNIGEDDEVASAQELERCIREVMERPRAEEFRNNAMQMKEAAKKALQEGGPSDARFSQFITELAVQKSIH